MILDNALNQAIPVFRALATVWWLWLLIFLVPAALAIWLAYIRELFRLTQFDWAMYEIVIPRELRKTPKAMEQVFQAIFYLQNSPSSAKEKWWDGEVTMWFCFEVVSFGGEIHFYLRIPRRHSDIVLSAIYAHYQDVEIKEVAEDYIYRFPRSYDELAGMGHDIFGNELRLTAPDVYPIRTYVDFEAPVEERELDPVSALLGLLSKCKPDQHLWLQMLIRPTVDDSWKKESEEVIKEFKERTARMSKESEFVGQLIFIERTPGQTETMKALERTLAKPAFETIIRYLMIAPKKALDVNFAQRGVLAVFNQYATAGWNKFGHNYAAWTRASWWFWPYFFPKKRQLYRKRNIYRNYRVRRMYETDTTTRFLEGGLKSANMGRMILNVEELATIFHLPTYLVMTGPLIRRIESRRVGPPAELPIFEEEEG
ncbi:MAG: hypothetical protein AAB539_03050 [Patescibacteria group bacterium]